MRYLIFVLLLAGCATAPSPSPAAAPSVHTIELEFVDNIQARCLFLDPAARACTIEGRIYLDGYGKFSGTQVHSLWVEFVSWDQLGKLCGRFTGGPACWSDAGALVYHDSQWGSPAAECYAGGLLMSAWKISEQYLRNLECELGHEVLFHVVGGHLHAAQKVGL